MKISKLLLSFGLLILGLATQAQVGIGTNTPAASAQLEVSSTTKGFLPPRMLASERTAIGSPVAGLMVYQTDGTKGLYYYDGSSWIFIIQTNITGNAGTATNLTGLTTSVSTLNNVSGSNSGDETAATIKTKLGVTTLSGSNTGDQDLSSYATSTALNNKVDKVSGKDLSTNDYSTTEKAKLAGITGTNTGDQDLTGKVDKVTGKGLSTNDYTSTEQTKLAAITGTNSGDETAAGIKTKLGVTTLSGSNTGDQDLSSYATSSALGNKVDKVTGKDLSTNDYTTTEKTKLAAITGSNTGDQTTITGNAGSATNLAAGVAGAVPYQTAANATGFTAAGSNGQVLTVAGGVPTWAAAASSGVPYTGASSAVDLGAYDLTVNGVKVGKGLGNVATNTAVGNSALSSNTTGGNNTSMGYQSLKNNTIGDYNTSIGNYSLLTNTTGLFNTAIGYAANVATNNLSNATAIGYQASAAASNSIQLGNTFVENVKTSGSLTSGTVTYPNAHNSTAGQVLTVNAAGAASWAASSAFPSKVEGTGFSGSLLVGHQTTGTLGSGAVFNTGVGIGAMQAISANGTGNTGTGYQALNSATSGQFNTATGLRALKSITTAIDNTAFGSFSLELNTGGQNTAIGTLSLNTNTTGTRNTAIGTYADVSAANLSNATAIGYNAKVATDNTIQLGNTSVTAVNTSGALVGGNTATSTISGFGANMNAQTGTTYTLSAADNGKIITLNNSAAITLTVPALFAGFNCMIVQLGAGAVTLTASGTTISNRSSLTKTAGANAIVTLIALSANSYISAGDMQ